MLYHKVVEDIKDRGFFYEDESRGMERQQLQYVVFPHAFNTGFPLLTTKEMDIKKIWGELLWFLKGRNDKKFLNDEGIHIWDKDIDNFNGKDSGRSYGHQWRSYSSSGETYDQMAALLQGLRDNPMGTRHLVTAWNPTELDKTALPPCHYSFQIMPRKLVSAEREPFLVSETAREAYSKMKFKNSIERNEYLDKLDLPKYSFQTIFNMRSSDVFLGLPYNIASYSILSFVIDQMTDYIATGVIGSLANIHIYDNQREAVNKLLRNSPDRYKAPIFEFSDNAKDLFKQFREDKISCGEVFDKLTINDADILDYDHYPSIKAEMVAPIM